MNADKAFATTVRQRQVTQLRSAGLTFAAIARQLGISPERVRQIEMRVLTRARSIAKTTHS
jgi:DNA-binding CsgD family transcriptional regulator